MSLDVLLVHPVAEIGGRRAHFLRDWGGSEVPASVAYPPIDLAHAASWLMAHDLAVEILDGVARGLDREDTARYVAERRPSLVAIPSAFGALGSDLELCRRIRALHAASTLVLSGPNATEDPATAICVLFPLATSVGPPRGPPPMPC